MPLVRGHHAIDDHFTQIPNDWVRDNRLTFKARGLMAMLMSHSQGWALSISQISRHTLEGKDAISSAVRELEKHGYLIRTQENNGKFGEAVWTTRDPGVADYPMADYPTTENPHTKKNNIKEEHIKNNIEPLFQEFWNEYPRKGDKTKSFRAFKNALKRARFEDIMAGVIAYKNDPTRKPDFTRMPPTWLNNDGWENAAITPERRIRFEQEREASKEFLRQQEELAKQAAPAPKCEHGKNVALCNVCVAN